MPEGWERAGVPVNKQAKPVWVDLRQIFPPQTGTAEGLELDEPCPGGLSRWLRATDGQWIGVVTYIVQKHDGSTFKANDQLVPARALRPR